MDRAAAIEVEVRLGIEGDRVKLEVVDDGVGISPDRIGDRSSLGLLGMSERARAIGGEVAVRPNAERGTTVEASLPL